MHGGSPSILYDGPQRTKLMGYSRAFAQSHAQRLRDLVTEILREASTSLHLWRSGYGTSLSTHGSRPAVLYWVIMHDA